MPDRRYVVRDRNGETEAIVRAHDAIIRSGSLQLLDAGDRTVDVFAPDTWSRATREETP